MTNGSKVKISAFKWLALTVLGVLLVFGGVKLYQTLISDTSDTETTGTLASVTTMTISNVNSNSAIGGGEVIDDGTATVTARGLVYGTSPDPTLSDSVVNGGMGTGSFSVDLTGLTDETTYYVRAYATNSVGTAYGVQRSFTTTTYASVTTATIDNIDSDSATSGGNVVDDGGATVFARGLVYATSSGPTLNDEVVVSGSRTGSFRASITGLTDDTTYYVRAYATNSTGTAYGNERSFTTAAIETGTTGAHTGNHDSTSGTVTTENDTTDSEPTASKATLTTTLVSEVDSNSAIAGGNVTDSGGATVTDRGLVYGTSPGPTLGSNVVTSGNGTGSFSASITGLADETTYYVRAYATNSAGTAYGNQRSFTTTTYASVSTAPVSDVDIDSATSGGEVTADGGDAVTSRGLVYGTSPAPTLNDSVIVSGSGIGSFSVSMTGLSNETTYYVRAYATNGVGTAYGNERSFTIATTYEVGDTGPANSTVFYDKGSYSDGWRYLEAAPEDQSTGIQWGCWGQAVSALGTAIGDGAANTAAIVDFHGDQGNFNGEDYYIYDGDYGTIGCNSLNDGEVAAKIVSDLTINGYDDWFLPSQDELNELYLQKDIVGGFASNYYWSSSQKDDNLAERAWLQYFADGSQNYPNKFNSVQVRAIRAF